MKIVQIAYGDWSGAGHSISEAINKYTGHESHIISHTVPNSYTNYPHDILDPSAEEITEWWNWADIIVLHDAADRLVPINCIGKPIIELYHGTWYRRDPEKVNRFAAFRRRKQLVLTPNLSIFGPDWIGRPISDLSPLREKNEAGFTVMHCPTSRKHKGTDNLIETLKGLRSDIKFKIVENVTNEQCILEKAEADLLIDEWIGGDGIGYGTNSLEAWALGIPVISHVDKETKERIIGFAKELPFVDAADDLCETIARFKDDADYYNLWANNGRRFIEEFHSPSKIAAKFTGICEEEIRAFVPVEHKKKISVCMIMRNEEGQIRQSLTSARELADEVIIVDTGSLDTSIDIARSLGAIVIEGGDRMHKSKERNRAIEAASGDWIVILDADEYITDPFGLRGDIENAINADYMTIVAGYSMLRGGKPAGWFSQNRCWKQDAFRYRFRTHELPYEFDGLPKTAFSSQVLFAHYPVPSSNSWKFTYSLDRLLLDVYENPGVPRPIYYLGRQYLYLKMYERAIKYLERFLNMTEIEGQWDRPNACWDLYYSYNALSEQETNSDKKNLLLKKAMHWLYAACLEQPMNRKWWYELGMIYHKLGKHHVAIALLSAMFAIPVGQQGGYASALTHGPEPFDLMARAMWKLGRYEEGYEFSKMACSLAPGNQHYLDNFGFFDRKLAEIVEGKKEQEDAGS